MTYTSGNFRDVQQVPWYIRESLASSQVALSEYLLDEFAAAFGVRPTYITFSSFPDGEFACIVIDGVLEVKHNLWGIDIGFSLHCAGIDISVVVRAASEFARAEASHKRVATERA